MRFSPVLTIVLGAALLAACGDDSNGPSVPNIPPTANFTSACTDLDCTFTDQSSDQDVGGSIASYDWDFGDSETSPETSPQHSFASAGVYTVQLTVTDNGGKTNAVSKQVTVSAAQPGGPHAQFTVACSSLDCTVDNTSTFSGSVTTWAWDFGDGDTSTEQNPAAHHYDVTALTPFTISLTVTSDGLTSTATQEINVAPPATLTCGSTANCSLVLDVASTVTVTLTSADCEAQGNTFVLTAPAVDTLFTNGCFDDVGSTFDLNNGDAYAAGTELKAEVISGISGIALKTAPALQVTGTFAAGWTLKFDDGAGGPGEPDFNDLVITVTATPE
jgi:PKD repeat protein